MATKLIILLCVASTARAGVISAAYAPVHSYQTPAITSQSQNIIRSYDGSQTLASYSKSIDTAFSSVNKQDTRITNNNGQLISPLGYAQTAYSAQPAIATYSHAAPTITTYAQAAPAVATYAHAAPAVATYASPAVATYAHAAPAVATYAHAAPAVTTYAHAAPAVATYAHAAPAVATYAAPAVATYAHAAPATYAHSAPGPIVAKAALSYTPAILASHVSYTGLGVNYGW